MCCDWRSRQSSVPTLTSCVSQQRTKLGPSSSSASTSSSSSTRPLRPQATGSSTVPIKRQMTGRSVGASSSSAPAAKRQTAMATGTSTRSALGERNARTPAAPLQQQMTGKSALGSSTSSSTSGGMKIPAGWGASAIVDTSSQATGPLAGAGTYAAGAQIRPQTTGGFRPRGSGSMSATGR